MCYTANTQDISHVNETTIGSRPTGRHLDYNDLPNEEAADRNLEKLNEFINNRQNKDDDRLDITIPETMAPESGTVSSLL